MTYDIEPLDAPGRSTDPAAPMFVLTVRGVGYAFAER